MEKYRPLIKKLLCIVAAFGAIAAVSFFCSLPFLTYLAAKGVVAPTGFLQNFLFLGFGFYFLGFIQLFLLIAWFILVFVICVAVYYYWTEEACK